MIGPTPLPFWVLKLKLMRKLRPVAGPLPPVNCASQFPCALLVSVGWIRLLPQLETNTARASKVKNASFFIDCLRIENAEGGEPIPSLAQVHKPEVDDKIALLRIERCG